MSSESVCNTMWHCLIPVSQGGKEIVQQGLPHIQLAPIWQLLLLGDGSLTRHLQLLTGERTEVDLIDMSEIGINSDGAPKAIQLLGRPRIRRQVWLRKVCGQRLAYTTSWWTANHVNEYLQKNNLPIWESLTSQRIEFYRDVQGIHYGKSVALELAFGQTGPFWGRHYLFWHQGQPLTLIYEVLSPYLRKYIGSELTYSPG
ncbi:MAG: chorismate lyase [Nostoc desertorum CM1-VF14]|jgi:chorismate lyase|nr:chorismate lyase [Nostoc desertorum CM1-VF14]